MYRRVLCDWYLSDGIHKPLRLDAPQNVEEALSEAGAIPTGASYEEHTFSEWIYRRTWRYKSEFTLPSPEKRAFLRLSGMRGSWRALVNGACAAEGDGDGAEFEVTALLKEPNRIELCFDPDKSGKIRPVWGFDGMLSYRLTGPAAVQEASFDEDAGGAKVFTAMSLVKDARCEWTFTLRNSLGESKAHYKEDLLAGYTPVARQLFAGKLQRGETNALTVSVKADGEESDEIGLDLFLPEEGTVPRGFVGRTEAMMGLGETAGANAAFTDGEEPTAAHRRLAARHGLESRTLEGVVPINALDALLPYDKLMALAGSESALDDNALWALTDSRRDCLDETLKEVPSGEVRQVTAQSRYRQAEDLRLRALDARLRGLPFVIGGADEGLEAPASCALMDDDRHLRPALYALVSAWQSQLAFVRLPGSIPEDGIFSCEVCFVSDEEISRPLTVCVAGYDESGNETSRTLFAAACPGTVGRCTMEIPSSGGLMIRTTLLKDGESLTVWDTAVLRPGTHFEDLPRTQLLAAQGRIANVGRAAALGVCVPSAGYFGCLLPGEYVNATREDPDDAEGLNVYM